MDLQRLRRLSIGQQRLPKFDVSQPEKEVWVWLKGNEERINMQVKIVDRKKDGQNWVYKLKDTSGADVDSGRYFSEKDLRN